jgi:hypothetical protein
MLKASRRSFPMIQKQLTVLLVQEHPEEFFRIRLKYRGSDITQCELTPTYRLEEEDQFISSSTYDLVLIHLEPSKGQALEGLHHMLQKLHQVPVVFMAPPVPAVLSR